MKTIGVKELHTNMKKITEATQKGASFLVMKNAKPVFRIEPIDDDAPRRFTLDDFKEVMFTTEDKDLSKKVDEIVYGASR